MSSPEEAPARGAPFPIVGVGASAGGLEAFSQLLRHLPLDTGMGFVLVQHLDPEHESSLVEILSRVTLLPVTEIAHGVQVEPDHVYVIPRDRSVAIEGGVLKLGKRVKTRAPHHPIDAFFESLSKDQHDLAIGVVLSGAADDGARGLEAIKAEGGITFAQDDSASYDSMPRSAAATGCVDMVLAPSEIARELARISKHPVVWHRTRSDPPQPQGSQVGEDGKPVGRSEEGGQDEEVVRKKILVLLRKHSGSDFSLYKAGTIRRRINRRMILTQCATAADYYAFLQDNSGELTSLYHDFLIHVTSFFRDPEMFEHLRRSVVPELLSRAGNDPLRCWVLGCSTGQEAYSMAMTLVEAADEAPRIPRLQVFATDLNAALLDKARHGLYPPTLSAEITPERLRRFFVEEHGGYRVTKSLREMVVFARHDLITDPPFSRMDLISCRNVLIYLEPDVQQRAMRTFHYALNPDGRLVLGASESIGRFTDLFTPVDKKLKIYSRNATPTPSRRLPITGGEARATYAAAGAPPLAAGETNPPSPSAQLERDAQREADRITISRFGPPSVVIDSDLQILQFRGATGAFLQPPTGKATLDVLKMAGDGLMLPLRATIDLAKEKGEPVRRDGVRFGSDGTDTTVNLEVIPLRSRGERCFLILFEGPNAPREATRRGETANSGPPAPRPEHDEGRIAQLENELADTRAYLRSIQEEHETASEDFQAAVEEAQSANEELQSLNEELETSKEEIESVNEELNTVNDEMSIRNVELIRLNTDLFNLQMSTDLAVVVLKPNLTVRDFSPRAGDQFGLNGADLGRSLDLRRLGLSVASGDGEFGVEGHLELEDIAAKVTADLEQRELEVRDRDGHWYLMRIRPYVSPDKGADGLVLALISIDSLKRSEKAAIEARRYAESIVETVREPLIVLDADLRVESANGRYYKMFSVSSEETIGRPVFELGRGQWNIERLRELLETVLTRDATVEDFVVEDDFDHLGRRSMLLNARRVLGPSGEGTPKVLVAIEDITEEVRRTEQAAREEKERIERIEELSRFNDVAVGRELRMIELKREVNELCKRCGEGERYSLESGEG